MDAIGGASGRRDAGPRASINTAPRDAGPGLFRAAPSVLTIRVRRPDGAAGWPPGRTARSLDSEVGVSDSGAARDSQSESQPLSLELSLVARRSRRRPRGSPGLY